MVSLPGVAGLSQHQAGGDFRRAYQSSQRRQLSQVYRQDRHPPCGLKIELNKYMFWLGAVHSFQLFCTALHALVREVLRYSYGHSLSMTMVNQGR